MKELISRNENQWGINDLQNKLLNILMDIDLFCTKHGVEYFLVDGSALGARRHSGFIPWDDDMDIGMTVSNYEKFRRMFIQNGDKNKYYLQEFGFVDGMVTRAKIRLNGSYLFEEIDKVIKRDIHMGISIDIFIFHNSPNKKILQHWQHFWCRYLRYKRAANLGYSNIKVGKSLMMIARLVPKMFMVKFALKQAYRWDRKDNHSPNKCNYVSTFYSEKGFDRAIYPKEWFEKTIRMQFETVELPVPCEIDKYLHKMYGDFEIIPPIEEIRKEKHAVEYSGDYVPQSIIDRIDCYKDERWAL